MSSSCTFQRAAILMVFVCSTGLTSCASDSGKGTKIAVTGDLVVVAFAPSPDLTQSLFCPDKDDTPQIVRAWYGLSDPPKLHRCDQDVPQMDHGSWIDFTDQVMSKCDGQKCTLPEPETVSPKRYWYICFKCPASSQPNQRGPKESSADKSMTTTKMPATITPNISLFDYQDVLGFFEQQMQVDDELQRSVGYKAQVLKAGQAFMEKMMADKLANGTGRVRQAEAILRMVELIAGRMTLLLEPGDREQLQLGTYGRVNLLADYYDPTNVIDLDSVMLPHQPSLVEATDSQLIRASVAFYNDSRLTLALGSAPAITSIMMFDRAGQLKHSVPLEPGKDVSIKFVLNGAKKEDDEFSCVFWDLNATRWSQDGCRLHRRTLLDGDDVDVEEQDGPGRWLVECRCNHLTNFAVLVSLRRTSELLLEDNQHQEHILRMITLIGCSLSVIALFFSFIYFNCRSDADDDRVRINVHFCANLFVVEILVLIGLEKSLAPSVPSICQAVGVLLHFFLLTSFCWSLMAGFQIYLLLVVVFHSEKSRLLYFKVLSYGMPVLLVAVSLIVDHVCFDSFTYRSHSYLPCWMNPNTLFVVTFLSPVTLIIVVNLAILLLVMVRVCRMTPRPKWFRQARGLTSLLFILGGTWIIGIVNNIYPNMVLTYSFTIINSLQGVFILLFYVILGEKFREAFCKRQFFGLSSDQRPRFLTNRQLSTTPTSCP